MPVVLSASRSAGPQPGRSEDTGIVIGLVNNMPDAALRTTERQFCELLSAASDDVAVCLRLFSIPQVPRGEEGRARVQERYEDIGELWTSRLDGLIVSGAEPRAPQLADEPYWPILAQLVDWAEDHGVSVIWSCLAAHAAALHLDGIPRRPLRQKLSGIFDCSRAGDHAIMFRGPRWRVPHSRYNELPEEALVSAGYRLLSRSEEAGADIFVKEERSLFIFLQGHPEYDPAALLREYRRDSCRFLAGEQSHYPEMPRHYFDDDARIVLAAYREAATSRPDPDLPARFPAIEKGRLSWGWRWPATQLYTNWLTYLVEHRVANFSSRPLAFQEVP